MYTYKLQDYKLISDVKLDSRVNFSRVELYNSKFKIFLNNSGWLFSMMPHRKVKFKIDKLRALTEGTKYINRRSNEKYIFFYDEKDESIIFNVEEFKPQKKVWIN
ncbi:MAG: hypothetical protein ABFQ65_03860 [Nanoarchaeota archaeon]